MNAIRSCGSTLTGRSDVNETQPRVIMTSNGNTDSGMSETAFAFPKSKSKFNLSVKVSGAGFPSVVTPPRDLPTQYKRCPIQVGSMYELYDGRIGVCMFIGQTHFNKKGIWVGLKLEKGAGKNNGTVKGHKYFLCRQGKGTFVRPQRVRRLVTEVSKSQVDPEDKSVIKDPKRNRYYRKKSIGDLVKATTPTYSKQDWLDFERKKKAQNDSGHSGWSPAQYDVSDDDDEINSPRTYYPKKELHSHMNERAERKPGSIEIGWAKDYKEAKYDVKLDGPPLFYPKSKLHEHDGERATHKPGPREIGRIEYDAANFKKDMEINRIREDQYGCYYSKSELHKRDNVKTPRKMGAIETGWAKDFQEAKYDVKLEDPPLFYPKNKLHEHDGQQATPKPGPRDIGRIEYDAANYNVDKEVNGIKQDEHLYYSKTELHKTDHIKTPRKIGPIETGFAEGFKEPNYDVKLDDPPLFYPMNKLHEHYGEQATPKPGPVELGLMDYDVANYNVDTKVNGIEQDEHLYYSKTELHKTDHIKTPRKLGPIETGFAEGFKEAKYDVKLDDPPLFYPMNKLHEHYGEQATPKPGPVELGLMEYDVANFKTDTKINGIKQDEHLYYSKTELHQRDNVKTPRKLGPIETGFAEGFKEAKYNVKLDDPPLFYPMNKLHEHDGEVATPKPGPIDIGLAEGFEAANFDTNIEDIEQGKHLYYSKAVLHKNDNEKSPRKIGAIETGFAEGFKEAKYNVKLDDPPLFYPKSKLHEHYGEHATPKPGPIETGRNEYNAAKFSTDIETTNEHLYYSKAELHKTDSVKRQRKIGAVESSWTDAFDQNNSIWPQKNEVKRSPSSQGESKPDSPKAKMQKVTDAVSVGGVSDADISAYLPKRISIGGTGTKGGMRNDFNGRSNMQTQSKFEDLEQDDFFEDILTFARKSLSNRQIKVSSA